ncbi:cyclin-dependent kinase E-1-like [Sesbania bispinosa]|nr:cyclin-dependent kinase E-1-like [Sesbania bispinosa]
MLSALVPCQPGETFVNYPTRPVDTTTDFEGTTNMQSSQQVTSGAGVPGNMPGHMSNRSVPRPMNVAGMQRMHHQAMQAYNLTSQAGMGGGMNPGGIPMQRGVPQANQQQQLRRKDQMGMPVKDLLHWALESGCYNMNYTAGTPKEPLEGNEHRKCWRYWRRMYILLIAVQFPCTCTAVRQDKKLDLIGFCQN